MAGGSELLELCSRKKKERKERAVGEQQQKGRAAQRQRGTRGTRASFGGAVAKLALATPANIGVLHRSCGTRALYRDYAVAVHTSRSRGDSK